MKKIITILLAVILTVTLSVPFFGAGDATGSITIKGIESNVTYKLYLILDLESYNADENAYAYQVNATWRGFFATAGALEYVDVDEDGYVTWKDGVPESGAAELAKLALAYAETHNIAPEKSSANTGDMTVSGTNGTFSNLALGYYLVDSNLGTLCGLTTTDTAAEITVKNGKPTLDKFVQEDSTLEWGKTNTADMGQTVHFFSTITAYTGAEGYVFHDVMPAGITYNEVVKILRENPRTRAAGTEVDAANYTVTPGADGHSFDVTFTQEFCDTLATGDLIHIYYDGTLNENATVAGAGNVDKAWLTYSESFSTAEVFTTTYTYAFDLVKTDSQGNLIDGAEFKIYDASTDGNEVPVVKVDDTTYRPAKAGETAVAALVKNGKIRFVGFDSDTYYLEETKAPEGYNKLLARQGFEIDGANLDSIVTQGVYTSGGVQVINKTGSLLPQTGGMGTTLFLAVGAVLVLGAGIILVARKRMSKIAE